MPISSKPFQFGSKSYSTKPEKSPVNLGDEGEYIFSVSDLNLQVQRLLESNFPSVLVSGEISNFSKPSSGHWYFTLKDDKAQIKAAMFKQRNRFSSFTPKDGQQVVARARLSLYSPRGDYQLIVDSLQPAGIGDLKLAYEALKAKLEAEGLFENSHKKPIPQWPQGIGIVSSKTGAALQDMLTVLKRRYPIASITVFPAAVQGANSSTQLIQALNAAAQHKKCDVILLARGGGSIEDLWSFNDEILARNIYACQTPVISGVGHETDFTIADFVADLRAPTPSAAAELASPDQVEILAILAGFEKNLETILRQKLQQYHQKLALLTAQLKHPKSRIEELKQSFDRVELQLTHAIQTCIQQRQFELHRASQPFKPETLKTIIVEKRTSLQSLSERLRCAQKQRFKDQRTQLTQQIQQLQLLSPLAILSRGYSITNDQNNTVIQSVKQVTAGQPLRIQVSDGTINVLVKR